ncbi:MAG: CYTH domain-containing protein [Myxococcales bacterium]|nr:MAG: CYTH domain-containing protein [Myxococcales bacterium]
MTSPHPYHEIEAKLRVDLHEPVRRRLGELGAQFIGRYLEHNHILDRPDRSLQAASCGLRVRSMDTLEGRPAAATLTYKGPPLPGPFKRREEIEVTLGLSEPRLLGSSVAEPRPSGSGSSTDSAVVCSSALNLLRALGYDTVLQYGKRRERWKLGQCTVELDDVADLGLFVEIEGPDESTISAAQSALNLAHVPHEPRSYVRMISERSAS